MVMLKRFHVQGYIPPSTDKFGRPLNKNRFFKGGKRRGRGNYNDDSTTFEQNHDIFVRNLDPSIYSQRTVDSLCSMETSKIDHNMIYQLIRHICLNDDKPGAILVFVPGWMDIKKVIEFLEEDDYFLRHIIIPLHSQMPTTSQRRIFETPKERGQRKIIVSTSIAETSITIDDVVHVIDCGYMKEANFDHKLQVKTLKPELVSIASAKQRRGRAGRVQPGVCYHLFLREQLNVMEPYQIPEINRICLDSIILCLLDLKITDVQSFLLDCLSPPSAEAIDYAINELIRMQAVTVNGYSIGTQPPSLKLSSLGQHLALLPIEPQIGKFILLGAIFSCLDPVLSIAACFSHKDPFFTPLFKEDEVMNRKKLLCPYTESDPMIYVEAIKQYESLPERARSSFCKRNFISSHTIDFIQGIKSQLVDHVKQAGFIQTADYSRPECNKYSSSHKVVQGIIVGGFYPSIVRVTSEKRQIMQPLWCSYRKVQSHPSSILCEKYFRANEPLKYFVNFKRLKGVSCVSIFDASPADTNALILFGSNLTKGFDEVSGKHLITIDRELQFNCEEGLFETICRLSKELDNLLAMKLHDTGGCEATIENRSLSVAHDRLISSVASLLES